MRVGLISDIHGNLCAVEGLLADMPDVDQIICAGDIVGYGPRPAAYFDRVRDVCSLVVQGNYDQAVERPDSYAHNELAQAGLAHAQGELTDEQRRWLAELPQRAELASGSYKLAHSHPAPQEQGTYVLPRHFPEMRPHLDDYDGFVIGHTHIQHRARIDNRLIVNPGSVGQPWDGNARAAYARLDVAE